MQIAHHPLAAGAFAAMLLCSPMVHAEGQIDPGTVEQILTDRVDVYRQTVGMVVAVIDGDETRYFATGNTAREGGFPVDANTVFEIGSITKVFTAILLADAVGRGQVTLDDPISTWMPDDVTIPSRNDIAINAELLATHFSGLPRMPNNFAPANAMNPFADYTERNLYEYLSGFLLVRDPGTSYEYSNVGSGLLGRLLEEATGMTFADLINERVTAPLGMSDTSIELTHGQRDRLALPHDHGCQPSENWDFDVLAGAGALRSTATDMARFLRAAMKNNETPVAKAIALSLAPRRDTGNGLVSVGLGWHIRTAGGMSIVYHDGTTGGYQSFIAFDAARELGVVVLSNSTNSIADIGLHLLDPKIDLVKLKAPREVVKIDPDILNDYEGRYELPPVVFTVTRRGDDLFVGITGQPELQVYPESDEKFFYTLVDAQLTFKRNELGDVTHLILHQFGIEQTAKRID